MSENIAKAETAAWADARALQPDAAALAAKSNPESSQEPAEKSNSPQNAPPPDKTVSVLGQLRTNRVWQIGAVALIGVAALVFVAWTYFKPPAVPPGLALSNGRIEAERVDIATKFAGRIAEVLVKEGDTVALGQVLARMDTLELAAQIREAEAGVRQAEQQLAQSHAIVAQRESELTLAEQQLGRSASLVDRGYAPREQFETRQSARETAVTAVSSATAQIALTKAMIEAGVAKVDSLKTNLVDSTLVAPRAGRIQYRLALPGEVMQAGGKVLTLLDLGDVYMTIFLPAKDAGRLAMESEARIILDAASQYVLPASVSFVAADAQFTPKYVETKTEREKLMFRVKVQIPRDVLERYATLVKTGVPGIAYVRVIRDTAWPEKLAVKLPDER